MPPYRKMVIPSVGALVLAGVLLLGHRATAEAAPPPVIGEEMRHVRHDFAAGGVRRLNLNWNACVDQARLSQDANVAERCVVYGYGALLLDANGETPPWMRHLTADIVAPGQVEMLAIMGIPEGPRQAWLDRYRRWVTEGYTPEQAAPPDSDRTPAKAYPVSFIPPSLPPLISDGGNRDTAADLAKAASGLSPREALRQADIAGALRQLLGQNLFAAL